PLPRETVLVLLNAIYFKGNWKNKFNKKLTDKEWFRGDRSAKIPMMFMRNGFNYARFADQSAMIELPYQNERLSMYIYLPEAKKPTPIAATLSTKTLEQKISQLKSTTVAVQIPKFKVE